MRTHNSGTLALPDAVIDAYAPNDQADRLKRLRRDHPEAVITGRGAMGDDHTRT